ncbi:uncharacterized protein DEA37_0007323 [Paragonimus westermani]|uniref:Uncharacterized protein n=1 Tax=Paragonimus westermani TaxID=34504 RepID=A0A5J4P3D2_9TREM|nr:uncharacterized protein DEA37_0007323 [Paragonimus westermani]
MTRKLQHTKFNKLFGTLCSFLRCSDSRGHEDNFTLPEIMAWGNIDMPFIDDYHRSDKTFTTYPLTSPTLCASFDKLSTLTEAERPDFRNQFSFTSHKPYRSSCGCFPCTFSKHLV